jgi:hypothetical protein
MSFSGGGTARTRTASSTRPGCPTITTCTWTTYDRTGNRTDRGASVELGNRLIGFDQYLLAYDEDGNLTH